MPIQPEIKSRIKKGWRQWVISIWLWSVFPVPSMLRHCWLGDRKHIWLTKTHVTHPRQSLPEHVEDATWVGTGQPRFITAVKTAVCKKIRSTWRQIWCRQYWGNPQCTDNVDLVSGQASGPQKITTPAMHKDGILGLPPNISQIQCKNSSVNESRDEEVSWRNLTRRLRLTAEPGEVGRVKHWVLDGQHQSILHHGRLTSCQVPVTECRQCRHVIPAKHLHQARQHLTDTLTLGTPPSGTVTPNRHTHTRNTSIRHGRT